MLTTCKLQVSQDGSSSENDKSANRILRKNSFKKVISKEVMHHVAGLDLHNVVVITNVVAHSDEIFQEVPELTKK
ncbi:hypothetical protein [Zobellia laminariae]|uniref:hypothetical protein n=1 Tax=Zobellia laminariae TaxID=248906 RepID=UPI0040561483